MNIASSIRPAAGEYAPYYEHYIGLVGDGDILAFLESQLADMLAMLRAIDDTAARFRYAADKWSVKEVLGHVIDTERVFAYRALRISRGDATPLASYDHDAFVANGNYHDRDWDGIIEEFAAVRRATLLLFAGMAAPMWERRGTAADNPVTVRALAWITAGHARHHAGVVRGKYLEVNCER